MKRLRDALKHLKIVKKTSDVGVLLAAAAAAAVVVVVAVVVVSAEESPLCSVPRYLRLLSWPLWSEPPVDFQYMILFPQEKDV